VRRVERWEGVGVSTLYLCPSASKVNRRTSFALRCISVGFVSKGPIGIDKSWLLKLSAFCASCGEEGVLVILLSSPVKVLVMLAMPLASTLACSKRSISFSSTGVFVRFRIVKVAIVETKRWRPRGCGHRVGGCLEEEFGDVSWSAGIKRWGLVASPLWD